MTTTQSTTQSTELTCIRVHGDDLAPGDVVGGGFGEPYEILEIEPTVHLPGWGRVRTGVIYWTQRQTTQETMFRHFDLRDFEVIAGPKLDAARTNSALVEKTGMSWRWVGGAE